MAREDEILKFGVEVESKKALAEFAKLQKGLSDRLKLIDKQSARIGKVGGKIWMGLGAKVRREYIPALKTADKVEKYAAANIARLGKTKELAHDLYIEALKKQQSLKVKLASTDRKIKPEYEAATKALSAQKDEVERLKDLWEDVGKEAGDFQQLQKDATQHIADMREKLEANLDVKDFVEGLKEGGENLRAPLKALLNDDVPEAFHSAAKLAGKVLISGMQVGAAKLRSKEKPDGAGKAGNGKLMKAAANALEKGASGLARMTPVFGVIADGLKEALHIFLKLDALVKDFNKSLTQGSDSAKFLAARGGDASAAYKDVSNQLEKVRMRAHSLDNLSLGITPQQHAETLNALAQEGQGMFEIGQAAARAGKPVEELSNDLVKASVAFSRHMGVSVAEITQLQSQMSTDIGVSLDQTDKKLAMLSMEAAESGMATNKFFNVIRQSSDDMNLFNHRMEDSARLLKMLSKNMNPKEAGKFMQSLTNLVGGQDLQSRLKLTLFADKGEKGAAQGIVMKDIDRRIGDMAQDLQLNTDEAKEMTTAIHKGTAETNKWIAKNTKKLTAAQKSAVTKASIDSTKALSGDLVNIASAAKNLGPKAGADLINKGLSKMPGLQGHSIDTLTGTDYIATSVFGLSEDVIDGFKQMNAGTDQMKQELVNKLKEGTELSGEDVALLKNLHINAQDSDAAAKLQAKDTDSIWEAMSTLQKDQIKGVKDVYNVQEKIAKDTVSMNDKLGIIAKWAQNQIASLPGGPAVAAAASGAVEVGGGIAKMVVVQTIATKAMAALPKVLGGAVSAATTGAAETAAVAAAEGAAVPAATAAGTAITGAGVAAGAAIAGAGLVAAGGLYAAYDQASKLSKESGEEGILGSLKSAWAGPSKALTPDEYDKKFGKPTATSTATPASTAAPSVNPAPVEVKGQTLDSIKKGIDDVVQGTKDTGISEVVKTLRDQNEVTLTDGFGVLAGILKRDVKLSKSFVENELGPMVEKSVLDAVRVALVEYSLYKDMSAGAITSALKQGGDAKSFVAGKVEAATAHAAGGFVAGQNPDGTAKVLKAPAGEMPTTIGKGETIVPKGGAGGGGTSVTVNVNGIGGSDLANMVKVAATNAIYEYKRREHLN